MKNKIKKIRSFIQTTFLLLRKKLKVFFQFKLSRISFPKVKFRRRKLIVSLFIILIITGGVAGISYGAIEYKKFSGLVKEAKQLTKKEEYNEAITKLNLAQNSWFVKNLGIKRQEINNQQKEIKELADDLSKYNQGLNKLDTGNYQEAINLFSEIPKNSFYSNNAKLKIEEAKRKIVEEELGKTKIAKKEAERKAKEEAIKRAQETAAKKVAQKKAKQEKAKRAQEELERKIAEQKLSERKAEERRMNADNDSDGLTYREELKLGTSDLNSDSDGDGIIDSKDTHPAGGGRNIAQTFTWGYGGYNWKWTASIQEDWYDYYKNKPRVVPESTEYVTDNDPFIQVISKKISEAATKDSLDKVSLAMAFVQSLSYVKDIYTGYDEYPKYPVETFVEKNGDCEDTSYLAASIISAMGIGDVLILLPGHMAVGVWAEPSQTGTYYEVNGRRYYYFETTGEGWQLGEIPDRFRYTPARLIEIPSGKIVKNVTPQYKKLCYASPDFFGYYSDGKNFYSDNQCNYLTHCMLYKDLYFNPGTKSFYWDSNCSQIVVKGCSKSIRYSGYFTNGTDYYSDSRCISKARFCRPSPNYSDTYYDGYNEYWDSNCTQKAVLWCSKSTYHPGYFFNSLDYKYYYDSQCTQKADL